MTPRRCDTCRYFDPLGKGGKCRRNPPAISAKVLKEHGDRGEWPWIHAADWCGSWVNKTQRSRQHKVTDAT